MPHHLLLIIHLICVCIWVGGHLYLALRLLPVILKKKDAAPLFEFGEKFEPLGLIALLLIIITGVWMAIQLNIEPSQWFQFGNPMEKTISIKIILLVSMLLLALSVRTRINPKIKTSPQKLPELAIHIILINLISLTMLILGTYLRYGGL